MTTSAPAPPPSSAPKCGATARRVGDARGEHEADRPQPEDRDAIALPHARDLDPMEAARERLDHGGDLGREPRRHREEVAHGDVRRHGDKLGVGAVQERQQALADRLLAAPARGALAAGGGVGGHDATAGRDVDPAELVAEGARRVGEEHRVAAPEGLQVGAVREGDLDLDERAARLRLRVGHGLEAHVARRVEAERAHQGVKTTLSARPER
jgi:hypothetical protein